MSERILAASIARLIVWTHATFISTIQDLTETQLAFQFENTASPCIAWHVWHAARLADRVQAGLADSAGLIDRSGVMANEHWSLKNLALNWKLDPRRLGVFEIGSEMKAALTPVVIQTGKESLLKYVEAAFSELNAIVEKIGDDELLSHTKTVANFTFERGVPGSMTVIPPTEVRVIDELLFYEGHTARHLGMVEALRGLIMDQGTATI